MRMLTLTGQLPDAAEDSAVETSDSGTPVKRASLIDGRRGVHKRGGTGNGSGGDGSAGNTSPRKAAQDAGPMTAREQFFLHRQLAQYYQAQIDLFAELCAGRSYHSIFQLEREFGYSDLVGCMANHKFPLAMRSSFTALLTALYVDRYPQQRLRLPETVHTLRDDSGVGKAVSISVAKYLTDAVSLVDKVNLNWDSADALPRFRIHESNTELLENEHEHYSHPGKMRPSRSHITHCITHCITHATFHHPPIDRVFWLADENKFQLLQEFVGAWFKVS
jgi:hypothetical protein